MASLTIIRSSEWSSRYREYEIYLDDEKVGEIANGVKKKFNIPSAEPLR